MRKLRYKFQIDAKTLLQNPFKNLTISDWIRVGYRFFEEVIEAVISDVPQTVATSNDRIAIGVGSEVLVYNNSQVRIF